MAAELKGIETALEHSLTNPIAWEKNQYIYRFSQHAAEIPDGHYP